MLQTDTSSLHRFWVDEQALLTFNLSGRFRDSDITNMSLTGNNKLAKAEIDYFTKKANEYHSVFDLFRVAGYRHNKMLYLGDHFSVFRYFRQLLDTNQLSARTGGWINNRKKLIVYNAINLLGLVSRKIADLIAVESPEIRPWKGANKNIEPAIERIEINSKFPTMFYSSALTIGVKGDGIWIPEVFKNNEGKDAIRIKRIMPETWFPTLNPAAVNEVTEHVFAWKVFSEGNRHILRRQTYGMGTIEHHANWLSGDKIGPELTDEEIIKNFGETGLPKDVKFKKIKTPIITHIPNLEFDEQHPFGISDYIDLKSPMDEINHRLTQLSRELDKHGNLSMRGPQLPDGELVTGKYMEFFEKNIKPEYIELPTGSLEVMMSEIELLIKWVCILAEISPGLLGFKEGSAPETAAALKIQSAPSVLKANRKRLFLTNSIQEAFRNAMLLENEMGIKKYKVDGLVNIGWKDGFPNSPKEDADLMALRTGNKPTISTEDAVRRLDPSAAEDMLKNLLEEKEIRIENSNLNNTATPPEEKENGNNANK